MLKSEGPSWQIFPLLFKLNQSTLNYFLRTSPELNHSVLIGF